MKAAGQEAASGAGRGEWSGQTRQEAIGWLLASLAIALACWAPSAAGLKPEAQRLAGLFLAGMVLWITEALPVGVTGLLVVAAQPLLKIATMPAAVGGFMSPVIFFVLAMFLIASVLHECGLDRRFARWLLARAGNGSRRVLLAFMVGTAAISTFVSDVPVCAIWATLALGCWREMAWCRDAPTLAGR